MSFLVGAYAGAPTDTHSPEFADFLRALGDRPAVGGLEIPSHHLNDEATRAVLAASVPDAWNHAVTCFPGTMFALNDNPAAGLAATDETARAAAVSQIAELRDSIAAYHQLGSGGRIRHVFLHSAPPGGTADALAVSLTEITGWDWDLDLHIEHCDQATPGLTPQKGFLSLVDELAVCEQFGVGLVVNWGRSAIETRSADGPVEHLTMARAAGRLTGLMFSGSAATDTDFGPAWVDAHLPTSTVTPASLLTPTEVARCLSAAGSPAIVGLKVGVRPLSSDVATRIAVIDQVLADLADAG